jgi:hypothetical protein
MLMNGSSPSGIVFAPVEWRKAFNRVKIPPQYDSSYLPQYNLPELRGRRDEAPFDSCSITFPLLDTIFYRFPLKVHPPAVWKFYPPFFGGHFSVNSPSHQASVLVNWVRLLNSELLFTDLC